MHNPTTESCDELAATGYRVIQPKKGYRFSIDPVLLAAFTGLKPGERCLDLGTGGGVLPLLLTSREPTLSVIGVEKEPAVSDRARRTMVLNKAMNVEIIQGDIRQIDAVIEPRSVDRVVSNPPYRRPQQGRIPPEGERAAARFELAGGLSDFIEAAAWALKPGGSFAIIHLAERTAELLTELQAAGMAPKRLRMVHPTINEAARMVMVEAKLGGQPLMDVMPPLVIYAGNKGGERCYTDEVLQIYGMMSV